MVEKFIDEYMIHLDGKIPEQYLSVVRGTLGVALKDYDVVRRETSLVPYTDIYPECYKVFMITKKIEGMSDKSLSLYKLYLEDMFRTINRPVNEITSNDIKVYLYMVKKNRNLSNRTLDSRRGVMSSFFSWSASEQYIDRDPTATIKPIKYERKEVDPLSDTELELIREACSDIREKAIVEFLYSTGCRVTELERLNINDVDFSKGEVLLFGKGNKHRTSYLTAKVMILLQGYLKSRNDKDPALFVNERAPHGRLHKSGIELIIREIGKRAGVEGLHPHQLRHTTATNALQHGMDVTQVQQLLGHARLDTTMIYAKVNKEDVRRNHHKYIA